MHWFECSAVSWQGAETHFRFGGGLADVPQIPSHYVPRGMFETGLGRFPHQKRCACTLGPPHVKAKPVTPNFLSSFNWLQRGKWESGEVPACFATTGVWSGTESNRGGCFDRLVQRQLWCGCCAEVFVLPSPVVQSWDLSNDKMPNWCSFKTASGPRERLVRGTKGGLRCYD